jgi:hypothetical protein
VKIVDKLSYLKKIDYSAMFFLIMGRKAERGGGGDQDILLILNIPLSF